MTRGLPVLLLLCSCKLISLDELEAKSRSTCSAARPCADGWRCGADGFCEKDTGGTCRPGEKRVCGSTMGECEQGEQVCSGGMFGACVGSVGPVEEVCDGKNNDCDDETDEDAVDAPPCQFDAGVCAGKRAPCGSTTCTAATFGPDYELAETRCDGRDNDCDGMTDEGLSQQCPEQRGECAGARALCSNGAFPACGAQQYGTNDQDWEAYETRCDGKDNDCNGAIDVWFPTNVSSSAARSRGAAAARSPAVPSDVVVFWEEELDAGMNNFKVRARVVHEDNTMSPVVTPSTTAASSDRSGNVAVAADGNELVAAWVEHNGSMRRVVIISVDPATGASRLTAMGALQVLTVAMPTEVAVAVDGAAQRALLAVVDGTNLNLVVLDLPLVGGAVRQQLNVATGVSRVRVAPAGATNFWLTYESGAGQVQRCLVNDSANRVCVPTPGAGSSPDIAPLTSAAPFAAASFLVQGDGGLGSSTCVDGGTCTATTPVALRGAATGLTSVRVAATTRDAPPSFIAWEDATSVRATTTGRDAGFSAVIMGARPQPLFVAPERGVIVYDNADDIFLARYCL